MRKIIISFCILFAALSLKAQSISGIRIDGGNTPILVYLGGNQMCLPTTSCFVANLRSGYYTIEVYATRSARPGERVWKGEKLFNERVYFNGNEVKDIFVENRGNVRPDNRPGQNTHRPNHDRPDYDRHARVMDNQLFKTFLNNVKKEPFKDDRISMINTALVSSDFTSGQCLQLVKLFNFDDDKVEIMKMMYPRIVDKEAFFTVISSLTFSSSKDKMNEFVRDYGRR